MKCDPIHKPSPTILAEISMGTAHFISFLTPEREVYVEAPVKFMAKNAATPGTRKSQARISILLGHAP